MLLTARRVLGLANDRLLYCWPEAVEQSSGRHYICFIADSVSTKTETRLFRQS